MTQEARKVATGTLLLMAAIAAGLLVFVAGGFGTGTASAGADDETTPTEEETTPEEDSPTEEEATPDTEPDSTEPEGDDTTPEGDMEEGESEADGERRGDKGDCPERERQESQAEPTTA